MSSLLAGRTAIVTGAASGVGEAIASRLAQSGARVIGLDVNLGGLEALVQRIREGGGAADAYRLDVSSEEEWEAFDPWFRSRYGGLHVFVGNAGIFDVRRLEDTSLDQWTKLIRINLDGVFLGTRTAVRLMKETPVLDGCLHAIINVSSIGAMIGAPFGSTYHMTKAGVRLFTKSVALECGALGYPIRANTVHPGTTETPMGSQLFRDRATITGSTEEEVRAGLVRLFPLGRLGQPDDVAGAVVFLAGPDANFMTGTELIIDGGFTAR